VRKFPSAIRQLKLQKKRVSMSPISQPDSGVERQNPFPWLAVETSAHFPGQVRAKKVPGTPEA
jgi:hypothetical protein